jgi:hypothetical protein
LPILWAAPRPGSHGVPPVGGEGAAPLSASLQSGAGAAQSTTLRDESCASERKVCEIPAPGAMLSRQFEFLALGDRLIQLNLIENGKVEWRHTMGEFGGDEGAK